MVNTAIQELKQQAGRRNRWRLWPTVAVILAALAIVGGYLAWRPTSVAPVSASAVTGSIVLPAGQEDGRHAKPNTTGTSSGDES